MTTILDALQNAEQNFGSGALLAVQIAKVQLHNAVELLERGYDAQDDIEALLEKYGTLDDVPEAD